MDKTAVKHRIAIVVSVPMTIEVFLRDQVLALARDYEVTVVANAEGPEALGELAPVVEFIPVRIERKIAPLYDLAALWALYRLFRKRHYHLVHSVTPKAGLLAMVAARLAGIPHRLHTYTGQVWVTRKGLIRKLLKGMDKIIAMAASRLLVDSPSQRRFLLAEGVIGEQDSEVLGDGSISGVDLTRFQPDTEKREQLRKELQLTSQAVVILFLGRLNWDKGTYDLAKAFAMLHEQHPYAVLVLVGPDEDDMAARVEEVLSSCSSALRMIDYTQQPEQIMAAADIFCLPSYREGFGSVVIEAGACGLPAVGSRIYGITDSIVDGESGLLVDAGDISGLTVALEKLVVDEEMRNRMGKCGQERAGRLFPQSRLTEELLLLYQRLLPPEAQDC